MLNAYCETVFENVIRLNENVLRGKEIAVHSNEMEVRRNENVFYETKKFSHE